MSYRTFKRVLGETSLERKCRWWFGVSLAVLLTLSFTWYGRRTDQIVKDLNHTFIGPELIRAGWLATHLSHLDKVEKSFYSDLVSSSRDMGRHFEWDAVLPAGGFETPPEQKFQPRDAHEQTWLADWAAPLNQTDQLQRAPAKADADLPQQFLSSPRGFRERYIVEADGRQSYLYYQPLYAQESCVRCHKHLDAGGRRPNLQPG